MSCILCSTRQFKIPTNPRMLLREYSLSKLFSFFVLSIMTIALQHGRGIAFLTLSIFAEGYKRALKDHLGVSQVVDVPNAEGDPKLFTRMVALPDAGQGCTLIRLYDRMNRVSSGAANRFKVIGVQDVILPHPAP